MIVLWVWIGAAVVALAILGIVAYDVVGRLRRFRRATDLVLSERVPRAKALVEGIQLQRSSGRHSVERRDEPVVRPPAGP